MRLPWGTGIINIPSGDIRLRKPPLIRKPPPLNAGTFGLRGGGFLSRHFFVSFFYLRNSAEGGKFFRFLMINWKKTITNRVSDVPKSEKFPPAAVICPYFWTKYEDFSPVAPFLSFCSKFSKQKLVFGSFSAPQAENFRNNRHHFINFYQYLVYFLLLFKYCFVAIKHKSSWEKNLMKKIQKVVLFWNVQK